MILLAAPYPRFIRALFVRRRLACFVALLTLWLLFPGRALAAGAETRLAIVVGNNASATLGRAELRYADDDAAKYAALFGSVGQEGDVELLARMDQDTARLFPTQSRVATAPTRAALDAAVRRIEERARAAMKRGERVVFTFVFAGHGDVEEGRGFLELEDGRYFREDLEAMLQRVPAARAHVLLDACNSVYMLTSRKPGGTRFATPEDIERSMRARLAHVGTFVSTSADAQVYEWSQIESGVFSHAVRSGLSGAADLNGDGRITYGELRAFVRVAAAGVPSPRFRPRIYARGPDGRDDEVVFEPRAAGGGRKVSLEVGAERRVTILDGNEVPLVEVRLESGFAPSLYLPASEGATFTLVEREGPQRERRTEFALSNGALVARAEPAPPRLVARGKAYDLLFALGFGPRAVASLPPEKQEEEVYGVSVEDREQMGRLLDAAAGMQRDRRIGLGIAGLGMGVLLGGLGAAVLVTPTAERDGRSAADTAGGVLLGVGVAGLAGGLVQLLTTSGLEDRRDAYRAALRARPEAYELAVREAESELFKRAEAARSVRKIGGVALVAAGALSLGAGLVVEGSGSPDKFVGRLLMPLGAAYIVLGAGSLALRSEEERLADLWKGERAADRAPKESSSLRLKPLIGLGTVGLAGTF